MEILINKCRICKSSKLKHILNLQKQPPANNLHNNKSLQKKFELKLLFCKDCSVVQISSSLSPKFLFNNYFWVTGTSKAAKDHAKKFFKITSKYLYKNSKIIEVASNDGTFLAPFSKKGFDVLGIDPAKNIAKIANKLSIRTINDFFSFNLAKKLKNKNQNASLIFARNVIPHVKNIHSVVKGISYLCNEKTTVAIEFHYSKFILKDLQYDSIYHEHIFYFSIKTITALFEKYNLYSFDASLSPISGGSVILFFSKIKRKKNIKLLELEKNEETYAINKLKTWQNFAIKSKNHSNNFKSKVKRLIKKNNDKVFGYGASARSSTLLNFCKLNNSHIEFIIDQNPLKKNFYTPGSNIKIVNLDDVKEKIKTKDMVLLAWNFKSEILRLMKKLKFKNKIILPINNEN